MSAHASREYPPRKDVIVKVIYSVTEFCSAYGISRSTFYNLRRKGRAPGVFKVGRLTLISCEAAETWRSRMERDTAPQTREAA